MGSNFISQSCESSAGDLGAQCRVQCGQAPPRCRWIHCATATDEKPAQECRRRVKNCKDMSFHVMFKGSIIWNMNKPPVAMTMIWLSISRFVQRLIVCSNPSSRDEPSCCAERSGSGCDWFDWSKEEPWILTSSIIWSAHVFLFEVLDFRGLFRSDRIAVDKIPRWTLIYFDHKALPMLIASFLRLYTNLVLLLGLDLALQTISHNIIAKLVHENWNSNYSQRASSSIEFTSLA